ncbi:hypothetical protein SLEP1_g11855 [Rubroshorea leprosula]|nr:hypothetical protein SLEP1_g11855 [Rubroshorea leprosula]
MWWVQRRQSARRVCYCCSCTMMELLVLGFYKVPTGLCKKVWKKRKHRQILKMKKQGVMGEEIRRSWMQRRIRWQRRSKKCRVCLKPRLGLF